MKEAKHAGQLIKQAGYVFNLAFTSVLKRAIRTLWIVLDELDRMWIPTLKSWRLNERLNGALQGLNKAETAKEFGEQQVHLWRSYDVRPPALQKTDERYPGSNPRYKSLSYDELPVTESLADTGKRFLPYWQNSIVPVIKEGKQVIIVAHGNSLRALVKYLDYISKNAIINLNIPTGIPLVYDLDDELKPIKHYYLGDQESLRKSL